ncbi:MAG TPA: hypothetical protein VL856_08380 [Acidimicrobiia bacterium]|nr:hypothetical protein [Acidimicrobiia bacterium]
MTVSTERAGTKAIAADGARDPTLLPIWAGVFLAADIAVVVLRSLARSGYLVQLDTAFGPRAPQIHWSLYAPVAALQSVSVHVLGGAATGRAYALIALALPGIGAAVLLRRLPWYAAATGIVLAELNPFVYERMVEGQWAVVAAAGFLLLWVSALEHARSKPQLRACIVLGVVGAAAVSVDNHAVGPLVALTVGAWWAYRKCSGANRVVLVASATSFVLLAHGIVAFAVSQGRFSYTTVSQFGPAAFSTFRANASSSITLFPRLFGLYGYWGERIGRFPAADARAAWWLGAVVVLCGLAVLGAKRDRRRAWLLVVGLFGIAVSASTALPGGARLAGRVGDVIPLLAVFREPQKWSALWLVALVALVPAALTRSVAVGARRLPAPVIALVAVAAILLPAGVSEIRNTSKIVTPVRYPASWTAAADYMGRHVPHGEQVVVLPWHQFEVFDFIGRPTIDPSGVFFPGRLFASTDAELPGERASSELQRFASLARGKSPARCAFAAELRQRSIQWALVLDLPDARRVTTSLTACGWTPRFAGRDGLRVLRAAEP